MTSPADAQHQPPPPRPRPSVRRWWQREPVLSLALLQAAIGVATAFGLDLTAEQVGAVMAFSAAALGWLAREQVTPMAVPQGR